MLCRHLSIAKICWNYVLMNKRFSRKSRLNEGIRIEETLAKNRSGLSEKNSFPAVDYKILFILKAPVKSPQAFQKVSVFRVWESLKAKSVSRWVLGWLLKLSEDFVPTFSVL